MRLDVLPDIGHALKAALLAVLHALKAFWHVLKHLFS
jgi:hypothetical protein